VSRVESPALRGTLLGTLLGFLNPVMRALLVSPLHWPLSRWFLVLSWKGAKTGRVYRTPVSYVSDEAGIFVTSGDRWTRYVIDNPTFRVRLRGRWIPATAVPISDPEDSRREHRRIFEEHTWFRWLAGIPSVEGHTDDAAVARATASGRNLIRIDPGSGHPT
jgi:F420H(2)-dependent quinone reductase